MSSRIRDGLIDLVLVLGTAVAVKAAMMPVAWKFAGPVSLLSAVLVATVLLVLRGQSWRDLGLVRIAGWRAKLLLLPQALLTFAVLIAVSLAYRTWIDPVLPIAASAEDRFADIDGSLGFYMLWLAIAVVHGGFFEEMIFRGFAITRLEQVFGPDSRWAMPAAILAQSVFFGVRHAYYQGWGGALATGLVGLAFGLLFWMFRRNLWPIIMAHAATGVLSMTARYLDSVLENSET